MSVHKLANILYYHIHPNFSRKSLLCPCMARKLTDNSWTIHHGQKWGEKTPKYPLTNKWIIKLIYPYSENENEIRSVVSDSLWPHGLYSLWNSPGHNTGVGSLSLLQGIFPTQESNQDLLHCRQIYILWNIIQPFKGMGFWYMLQHEWNLKYSARWNKPDTKGQILYYSTYLRYLCQVASVVFDSV